MGQLDESCVYINKVGTFGVNCASYWCSVRDKGYAPSSGKVPDRRHAPVRGRPGVAGGEDG